MTKTGFLICFLFIVNKAFAQVDNFYYTNVNRQKRVEFERSYIYN